MNLARIAISLAATAWCVACAARRPTAAPATANERHAAPVDSPAVSFEWTTRLDRDHPLVGRIWDVSRARFATREELEAAIAQVRFVLLGEKHDNPDHHRLQAEMIAAMVRRGRRPVVALEMLDSDDQSSVDASARTNPGSVDAFFKAVAWDRKGWPPASEYAPVVRAALESGLPIAAANMTSTETKALVHQGVGALDPQRVARLGLTTPMPDELTASLRLELADSHCGMLPEAMFDPMVLAQRARDAEMAETLLASGKQSGAVLIAGTGHARMDRGVPWQLARRGETNVVSVAFTEVEYDDLDPTRYAASWHAQALPFTYVWFTPRATDEDPCQGMRKAKP
jgi:uncharacterized iron-regulated protein